MSKLIVVCGLPGSGKTMLADALSEHLNIVCLHKDSIKESLYDASDGRTLDDSKRIGKWSVELLLDLAEEQIRNGVDVIIESPFNYPDEAELFAEWKEKYGVDFYAVICGIDYEMRMKRYADRANTTRHPSHHDIARLDIKEKGGSAFDGIDTFDYSIMPDKKIFVTTDKPVSELIDQVVADMVV